MADINDTADTIAPAAESPAGKRKKHMIIYRGADAGELGSDQMPFVGVDDGVMAGFAKLGAAGAADAMGAITSVLFCEPEAAELSLCHAWFKSDYVLPRHSHSADCIYYVLSGEVAMGTQTLRKGDGIFIPANDAYTLKAGPQGAEVLEFRNATHFDIHFKGNDEAHWDRMAKVQVDKKDVWPEEVKPSS